MQNPWSQTNRGTAQSRPQKNQDILSRAKQNVQENDEDLLKEADRMQHELQEEQQTHQSDTEWKSCNAESTACRTADWSRF